jgi:hypothetical protein
MTTLSKLLKELDLTGARRGHHPEEAHATNRTDTSPIVERKDEALHGERRTKHLIPERYDEPCGRLS